MKFAGVIIGCLCILQLAFGQAPAPAEKIDRAYSFDAGIQAGLSALRGVSQAAFITGCDAPLLTPEFVSRMVHLLGHFSTVVFKKKKELASQLRLVFGGTCLKYGVIITREQRWTTNNT